MIQSEKVGVCFFAIILENFERTCDPDFRFLKEGNCKKITI